MCNGLFHFNQSRKPELHKIDACQGYHDNSHHGIFVPQRLLWLKSQLFIQRTRQVILSMEQCQQILHPTRLNVQLRVKLKVGHGCLPWPKSWLKVTANVNFHNLFEQSSRWGDCKMDGLTPDIQRVLWEEETHFQLWEVSFGWQINLDLN